MSLPYNLNHHNNFVGIYVGEFYESPNFDEIYHHETSDQYRGISAGDQTVSILHQFYSKDKQECLKVEANLSGAYDAIIEVIISECSKKSDTFMFHSYSKGVNILDGYGTPFN